MEKKNLELLAFLRCYCGNIIESAAIIISDSTKHQRVVGGSHRSSSLAILLCDVYTTARILGRQD